jgi:hypothetical protein
VELQDRAVASNTKALRDMAKDFVEFIREVHKSGPPVDAESED